MGDVKEMQTTLKAKRNVQKLAKWLKYSTRLCYVTQLAGNKSAYYDN